MRTHPFAVSRTVRALVGAALLVLAAIPVRGQDVSASRAAFARTLIAAAAAGDSARAAVFGQLANGPLFQISVPDVHRLADYRAAVVEVSDETNALREDVSSFTPTFARQ